MKRLLVCVPILAVAGCAAIGGTARAPAPPPPTPKPPAAASAPKPAIGTWGFDLAGMDKAEKPGNDFFCYVDGAWYNRATIPADRPSTGAFSELDILSEDRTQAIIQGLQTKSSGLDAEQIKIRDLYDSFNNEARLEQEGLAPARGDLDAIAGLKTLADVGRAMGSVAMGTKSVFDTGIGIDDKNPDAYAIFVGQSGLGLPDRDYYLSDDPGIVKVRDAYKTYIAQILNLGGYADAKTKAARIFVLETAIAKIQWPREERRQADKVYNPMTIDELAKFAPQFPWRAYFGEMEIGPPPGSQDLGARRVVIAEKSAFPPLAKLFADTPVAVWRDYLTFHYLSDHAGYLPKRFDDANFALYGKLIGGRDEQLPRDRRAVRFTGRALGEAVGKIFVAKYFPPEAKAKAQQLVAKLLKVYADRIQTRDWMSPETRAKALDKAKRMTVKIGYPDKWRDYTAFKVSPDNLLANVQNSTEFRWHHDLYRLDDKVDRSEWGMSPQTVNAYYNPSLNEIVFPAAILQPPFFDPNADDAVNYGGIGAVIGHEMSHAFDDQGSKYDARGVLENWWTPQDRKNFDARTKTLAGQYDTYSPLPGMHVNGQLTLGENIADLSGLSIAYAAYHLSLGGKDAPVLNGFTGDQRFFLGYGQVWRYKSREGSIRDRLLTDPHSPPRYRVDGATRNLDAWYSAFNVQPGDKYYLPPNGRVRLW